MRIPGWLLGGAGFAALFLFTALCSVLTFSAMRQAVIDTQASGILLESPGEVVAAVLNPGSLPTAAPPTAEPQVTIPLIVTVPPTAIAIADPVTAGPDAPPTSEAAPTTAPVLATEAVIAAWDDPRQVRILLMGIDQRAETGEQGPFRTDTMMLLNVDPVGKRAGLISIPRDLWVDIPNFEPNRINTANAIGDANAYPGGGGPALAMETVAANLGVRVDKYVLINFDVFLAVADLLAPNGIEVCIDQVIDDPYYPDDLYGTIAVHFDPGCQRLDAEHLLQYARTRKTEGGDYDRARRQQQVLDAMRAELLSAGGVAQFITQAPALWAELTGGYRTNLTYEEVLQLGMLVGEIGADDIRSAVIDQNYVQPGTTPEGDQVLVPIQSRISDLIQRVFYDEVFVADSTGVGDLKSRADAEFAPIYVYNGTDVAGLAGDVREWMTGRGVNVTGVGNTTAPVSQTIIRDYGGRYPDTARYLAGLLGIGPERIQPGTDGLIADGVMVVAGSDVQPLLRSGG
jgi:polyisoprenyl-teichoic acid--peptidoglycan teichoic acid transferase